MQQPHGLHALAAPQRRLQHGKLSYNHCIRNDLAGAAPAEIGYRSRVTGSHETAATDRLCA
jgi:hypothetical protein